MAASLSQEEMKAVLDCESIDGDLEFMLTILEMLVTNLTTKVASIDTAVGSKNFEAVWKDAHSIKGSAMQCSLQQLAEAAKNMEHHFKALDSGSVAPDDAAMQTLVLTLKSEAARVQGSTAALRVQQAGA